MAALSPRRCVSSVRDRARLSETDPDAERLVAWLESVLASRDRIVPTPNGIAELLGSRSPAHQLDHDVLRSLLEEAAADPEVQLKKDLWAKLLRTAFGEAFVEDDRLFVNHTLLVMTAEAIAHEIIGFDLAAGEVAPADVLTGARFHEAGVHGVVEEDFFDWVLAVDGGVDLIKTVIRRVSRFDWSQVEHDVLKVLYESVIDVRDRESLGEYYTPDWLASEMVADRIRTPASQRVLDPSCGSGTFVFHAVRAHLAAVDAINVSAGSAVNSAVAHVFGLDIHPVAVTLARVTYLMALGPQRLNHTDRKPFTVPIFLGDALQWERNKDLFADEDELSLSTEGDELVSGGGALFGDTLVFPRECWVDAGRFDALVRWMADRATSVSGLDRHTRRSIEGGLRRFASSATSRATLYATFEAWHRLHSSGRDHIWSYYVRNLVKPLWLAQEANRVDVLIGNPPWLRYSKMTPSMQDRYKALAGARSLLSGGLGASARDLSTLFVARAVELYLRDGGRFAFVMPHGTITRRPHAGFRGGRWGGDVTGGLSVGFEVPWDTSKAATGFPMTSCVVRGRSGFQQHMPTSTRAISTRRATGCWVLNWEDSSVAAIGLEATDAHYESRFRQGAIVVPRMLLSVVRESSGPLGLGAGRVRLRSLRSAQEKPPWKGLPDISGIVEERFVRTMHLGSTVAPFRVLDPWLVVLPMTDDAMLTEDEIDGYGDLSRWWSSVEATWAANRAATETAALRNRMDYHQQLSAQLPLNADRRVVYPKSGNILCAATVTDPSAIIDHKLYWARVVSTDESRYLLGMLNSPALVQRVRQYQAIGLFGARDFDKYVFRADFPEFDPKQPDHAELVELAAQCETAADEIDLSAARTFQQARRAITGRITERQLLPKLNDVAQRILGPQPGT